MWTIPCGGGGSAHLTGASRLARAGSSIPPARARRPKSLPRPAAVLSVCGTLLVGDEHPRVQRDLLPVV